VGYQERRSIVSLVSMVLITLVYLVALAALYPGAGAEPDVLYRFWGAAIALFVPAQVVPRIVILVVFMIFSMMTTAETEPDLVDEFDRMVDLRAMRNFSYAFSAGFFLAMGALALGGSLEVMFAILLGNVVVAGTVLEVSQLLYYRRGF
jgi:hypothetical protein